MNDHLIALKDIVKSASAIHFARSLGSEDAVSVRSDGTPELNIVAPATYGDFDKQPGTGGPKINALRLSNGIEVRVTLNSIGAEKNRHNTALLDHLQEDGDLPFPHLKVKGRAPVNGPWEISVLEAPHGSCDTYFRKSNEYDDHNPQRMPFGARDLRDNLTELYRWSPSALVNGLWNSFENAAARIPRAMTSVIEGVTSFPNGTEQQPLDMFDIRVHLRANRRDPLVKGSITRPEDWAADAKAGKDKKDKAKSAKQAGSGKEDKNLVSKDGLGDIMASKETTRVRIDYALAKTTISLAAMRQYRFPNEDGAMNAERNLAGRTVAAALALLMYELGCQRGYYLRSGCALVVKETLARGIVHADGTMASLPWDIEGVDHLQASRDLYIAAVEDAKKHGLSFQETDLVWTASKDLNAVVDQTARNTSENAIADEAVQGKAPA